MIYGEAPVSISNNDYRVGSRITVNAPAPSSTAYKFAFWASYDTVENEISQVISTKNSFTFFLKDEIALYAVYLPSAATTQNASTSAILSVFSNDQKLFISTYAEAAEGCTLIAEGIVATSSTDSSFDIDSLTISNAEYCRYGGRGEAEYQFTWAKKLTSETTWYVRSFTTVINDTTGVISTIYGSLTYSIPITIE